MMDLTVAGYVDDAMDPGRGCVVRGTGPVKKGWALLVAVHLVLCLAGREAGEAATITVDLNGGGDFNAIQPALDAAEDGDTVLVRPGTYLIEESLDLNRGGRGKNLVLRAAEGPQGTVLTSVGQRVPPIIFQSGESASSVLEGFTVADGGAIVVRGASPTFVNLEIRRNGGSPYDDGGGIYCVDGSLRLVDCVIADNDADCDDDGGGIFATGSSLRLENCVISGNQALCRGGGIYHEGASVFMSGCTVIGNRAESGGGIRSNGSVTLFNCLIAANETRTAITSATLTLIHSTVADNREDQFNGAFGDRPSLTISNSIVWGNRIGFRLAPEGKVTHSCIEGEGIWPGEGNINQPPLFVGAGDYRLLADSPCIDAGALVEGFGVDLEGNGRPCGPSVDMGAYEFGNCNPDAAFVRGDCNRDGAVDVSDAVCILGWLFLHSSAPGCLAATNANGDMNINIADVIYLLGALFLRGPPPPLPFPDCGPGSLAVDNQLGCARPQLCHP